MAFVDGQLYFAPGVLMKDLDFANHDALLDAFTRRVEGLFVEPIRTLERWHGEDQGALFGAAMLVAALIESLARFETGSAAQGTLISQWLEAHLPAFRELVTIKGEAKTLAHVFESRFRNGLAHNGYIPSLGRLSRSIPGPVLADGDIVTINPFSLAIETQNWLSSYVAALSDGSRDVRRFAYQVEQQFRDEVIRARAEAR